MYSWLKFQLNVSYSNCRSNLHEMKSQILLKTILNHIMMDLILKYFIYLASQDSKFFIFNLTETFQKFKFSFFNIYIFTFVNNPCLIVLVTLFF
jgi:hypothetical protein